MRSMRRAIPRKARLGLLLIALGLCSAPVMAHDFWLEPTTFAPKHGDIVGLRLRVGEHLAGEPVPLVPARVNQFIAQVDGDRTPIGGRRGMDPAGFLRIQKSGLLAIGYHSHPDTLELPAEKFNVYLKEEGLESILELRAQRRETDANGREQFFRCAKTLLLAGAADAAVDDQRLGFPLELSAERSPYQLGASGDLPVRLTYLEQPLEGALVVAINSRNPAEKQSARTDRDGRVRFRLLPGGMWLVKAVHMVPAPAGADAEWASYWASLTFQVRAVAG